MIEHNPVVRGVPPLPSAAIIRPISIMAIPIDSSLRKVFNLVMSGMRGSVGWDDTGDNLILYYKVDEQGARELELTEGHEFWACFHVGEKFNSEAS